MHEEAMPAQLPLPLPLNPDPSLESFFPGANVRALGLVCQLLAEAGEPLLSLCCHGPSGSGKTHLLLAAARAWRGQGKTASYLALERLGGPPPASDARFEKASLYCLDDVEVVAGKPDKERALFVFLNDLRRNKVRVLWASKHPPGEIQVDLPDLRSRLSWGAVARLRRLDGDDLRGLVAFQAQLLGLSLSDKLAHYLLSRLPRHPEAVIQCMRQLSECSLASGRRLTIPMVRDSLAWSK